MKLLSADHTEHTVTMQLDNGLEFTATAVHEDVIAEVQKELYGQSYGPLEPQPETPSNKPVKPITPDPETTFI